jgi:hypothetical protein
MYLAEDPSPHSIRQSLFGLMWAAVRSVFWYLLAPLAIALVFVVWLGFPLQSMSMGVDFRAVLVTMPFVVLMVLLAASAASKQSNPDADAEAIAFGPERPECVLLRAMCAARQRRRQ